jgi:RNA polymerase subunit RPABC4/transcription elongation factor Spt4
MALSTKKQGPFFCLACNKELQFKTYNHYHKFCDNACQGQLKSRITSERDKHLFTEGKLKSRPAIKRQITEAKGYICEKCGLGNEWQGASITLQVDHISGDPYDNSPSNLRLLCPNCHSQTATFGSKNKGNGRWSKENLARYYPKAG